jgi:TRAP-type C4-dicarboxylate transport system substrate-binding protein
MSKITTIRWVIAHEPVRLFYRSAKDFETALNKILKDSDSDEQLAVEVMTPAEYSIKYNNGVLITKHDLLDLMDQGRVEMTQMYTTWMAEKYAPELLAFEMPFIFRDHDHATRVLEGDVGEKLLGKIQERSKGKLRALSYTYSGGFRCAIVNEKVSSLGELVGKTVRSNRNPVAQAIWKSLGATPYVCEIEETTEKFEQKLIDAADTVYSRVYPLNQDSYTETVIDSKHTLFLTTMLVSEQFWDSLSDNVRAIIKSAAVEAGRLERLETIEDGDQARQQLIKDGATVIDLSAEDEKMFRERTAVVYEQFADLFELGLIDQIKRT